MANSQRYIQEQNITRYRGLIAASERDPARDEERHKVLLRLLAEEEAAAKAAKT